MFNRHAMGGPELTKTILIKQSNEVYQINLQQSANISRLYISSDEGYQPTLIFTGR